MSNAALEPNTLDPLLRPRSVAIVGASERPGSFGRIVLDGLIAGGFGGTILPVNPGYTNVAGLPCVPSLQSASHPVDCALLAVGNERLEGALEDAAAAGARAAVVFGSAHGQARDGGPLSHRLAEIARASGMALCGGNSMGVLNPTERYFATGYPYRGDPTPGHVTLVSHSGSAFSALANNRRGLRFNTLVSCGQELGATAGDYVRWAVAQPETRAVGCFLETVRDGPAFRAALVAAAERGIPVAVLKVGASAQGQRLVEAHSGALAGEDAQHDAALRSLGAIRVRSLDELLDTLELAAADRRPTGRGLALATDSGGERALICDAVAARGVAFAELAPATTARVRAALDPELEPGNPLDLWGSGDGFVESYAACLTALAEDPGVHLTVFAVDLIPRSRLLEPYVEIALRVARETGAPFAVLANVAATADEAAQARLRAAGIPVLLGTEHGLAAIGHLLGLPERHRAVVASGAIRGNETGFESHLEASLTYQRHTVLDEVRAKALLAGYGLPRVDEWTTSSSGEAVHVARSIGFPVVMKTAMPGVMHKFDDGGVILGLRSATAVLRAYRDLRTRFGAEVVVQRQVETGRAHELYLGMTRSPEWGPVVTVGFGGIDIETTRDAVSVLPPVTPDEAHALLRGLRGYPLLLGTRGRPPADLDALARAVSGFGRMCAAFPDVFEAIDVNPLIVGEDGVVAVDATVILTERTARNLRRNRPALDTTGSFPPRGTTGGPPFYAIGATTCPSGTAAG